MATDMARLGEALELAGEPELYTTGALDDLLEELVSVQLQAAPKASTSLRFRVRDPRWIAHLKPSVELGSTASTLRDHSHQPCRKASRVLRST